MTLLRRLYALPMVFHTLYFVLVLLAVVVARLTVAQPGGPALVWPAAGVALWWALSAHRRGSSVMIPVLLVGLGTGLFNFLTGLSPLVATVFGLGNAIQVAVAVLATTTMRRIAGRSAIVRVRDLTDVGILAVGVALGSSVAILCGPLALWIINGQPFLTTAVAWFLRHAVGTFVMVAPLLRLSDSSLRALKHSRVFGTRSPVEYVALLVLTAVAYFVTFGTTGEFAVVFAPIVLSAWVSFRFQTTLASFHFMVAATFAVWASVEGMGPFADTDSQTASVLAFGFVAVGAAVTWVVSMQRDDRARLVVDLEASHKRAADHAAFLTAVIETSSDALAVVDKDLRIVLTNATARDLFADALEAHDQGLRAGSAIKSLATGEPLTDQDDPVERVARGEASAEIDALVTPASRDAQRAIHMSARQLPASAGPWQGAVVLAARDVTDERELELAMRAARDQYAMLLAAATEQAIIACDADGYMVLANVGAHRISGREPRWFAGRHIAELHDSFDLELVASSLGMTAREVHAAHANRQWTAPRRWRWRGPARQLITVEMTITPTPDGGFLCVATDVSSAAAAEARLIDSEARFRQAFDIAPVSMFLLGLGRPEFCTVDAANATAARFLSFSMDEMLNSSLVSFVHPDDADSFRSWLRACRDTAGDHCTLEARFIAQGGVEKWGLASASLISPQSDGDIEPYLLCLIEDITARRAAEQEIVRQALRDELTSLPNRTFLRDTLATVTAELDKSQGELVGVLLCDLDGFKDVNDVYGHAVGDEVLREVARRFANTCHGQDTLARLGGDEFAIVCPKVESIAELREYARNFLGALEEPVSSSRADHQLGVSIGMVLGSSNSSVEELLAHADSAMYEAKRLGRNTSYAYDEALRERSERTAQLLPEFVRAIENEEFEMYGQPVVDFHTGEVVAIETLLRWIHPDRGVLPPGAFLDVLETSPHMPEVGARVLKRSCEIAATWPAGSGGRPATVHVNVSGRQMMPGRIVPYVNAALESSGLDPRRLVVELTETSMPQLSDQLVAELEDLRSMGVKIAIDDLGTGYSSLARLTELPIDMLKIDRSFVAAMGEDPRCDAVVRAVIGMGAALGLDVVAEGVEKGVHELELARLGCRLGQGYLYSRPIPPGELASVISSPWAGAPRALRPGSTLSAFKR